MFLSLLIASNPDFVSVEYLLQRKLFLHALQKIEEIIADDYQGEDAYALRGRILSIRGRYADAMVDYDYGLASKRIWHREGEAYATTLRLYWECDKASEWRESIRRFGRLPPGARLRLYAEQIRDLRYCGEIDRAWALQAEMEGVYPRAVLTHFASAELFLDQGDIDSAFRELGFSQLYFKHAGWKDVAARIALMEGRYEQAFQLMQYIQVQRVPDDAMVRFMLSALLANDPTIVIHKTSFLRWMATENPNILYLRMKAFQSLEMEKEAEEEKQWYEANCNQLCQERVLWSLQRELGFRLEDHL